MTRKGTTAADTAPCAAQQVIDAAEQRCQRLLMSMTPDSPRCTAEANETMARWRAEAAAQAILLQEQSRPMPVSVLDDRGTIQYMNLAPGQTFFFVDHLFHDERRFRTVSAFVADDIDERVLLEITSLASGATYVLKVPNDTRVQLLP